MKVWITKWALTQGIKECEAEWNDTFPNMVKIGQSNIVHKPYWHTTLKEAQKKAESMRIEKIKSLTKQIERLQKKLFI